MKKVLFVATVVKKHIMVFHIPYLKLFKQKGYEVHVCAKNDFDNEADCIIPYCDKFFNLEFNRSPFKLKNIKVYNELKKIINSNNYDIIHCHTPMGGALTRLAASSIRKTGSKVIYTAHGFHFYKKAPLKNWIIYYPIEKWLSRYTDILITINKEDYERAKRFQSKELVYIPGVGININEINKVKTNPLMIQEELGIPENSFIILSIGELNKNKNHEVIIRAIAKLKNKHIHYLVCGYGPCEKYLIQLAKKLGVSEQVKLLGFRKDVHAIYPIADLFAFPSYREGLSVSLMEAMAFGLPIVCSNIRGNSDLIDSNIGGKLINPNDIDGFAEVIDQVFLDNKFLNGHHNLRVIERYDINNVMKSMKEVYRLN